MTVVTAKQEQTPRDPGRRGGGRGIRRTLFIVLATLRNVRHVLSPLLEPWFSSRDSTRTDFRLTGDAATATQTRAMSLPTETRATTLTNPRNLPSQAYTCTQEHPVLS